jgi:hypothetical protein
MDEANDPRFNFYVNPSVEELIGQQGKRPLKDPSILLGDFWPEDEPIERFLAALDDWRGHKRTDRAA